MFSLIYLFELGSAILVGIGSSVKQDAWIVLCIGLISGLLTFLIYHRLFLYYPDLPLTSYIQILTGKWIGRSLAFIYVIFFIYDASRVLRDFGELLTSTSYSYTPLLIINSLMILASIYAIHKGLEVMARVCELSFIVVFLISIIGFLIVTVSGLIQLENLTPILENGMIPVLKTAMKESILYPFGEMVVFTMILPQLNKSAQVKKVCLAAILLGGADIIITSIINISSLGVDLFIRSPFPLLSTIRKIQLLHFIERLDVLFMLYVVIGGFFKISLFFYAAVYGATDLFRFKEQSNLIFPIGFIILLCSLSLASNTSEHFKEGLNIWYYYWPVEIIIPMILLLIARFRNRQKQLQNGN